jgi:hypothetical protein
MAMGDQGAREEMIVTEVRALGGISLRSLMHSEMSDGWARPATGRGERDGVPLAAFNSSI